MAKYKHRPIAKKYREGKLATVMVVREIEDTEGNELHPSCNTGQGDHIVCKRNRSA